jgi:hypothetical protein
MSIEREDEDDATGLPANEIRVVELAERREAKAAAEAASEADATDDDAGLFWSGNPNDQSNDLYRQNNERERRLWGNLIADKRVVQRMGLGVWYVDKAKKLVNVGDRTVTEDELRAMAMRERRRLGLAKRDAAREAA